MEVLIVISGGIAFGALIAYLWNSDRALKEKNRLLEIAESRLAVLSGETGNETPASSTSETERIADLERQINDLTKERSKLHAQLEGINRERISQQQASPEITSATAGLSENIVKLDSENSVLRSQIAALEAERDGDRQRIESLQNQHGALSSLEERAAKLQGEKTELAEKLKKAESDRESVSQRILDLESVEAKFPQLESRLASLSDENTRLLKQISDLQVSMRQKIKTQLDALQELYQNLDAGKS